MDDIGGAAQMLEVSIKGMTMAGRATIETAKMLQRLLLLSMSFLKFIAKLPFKGRRYFKYKKTKGRTNIDNLKQKGGTLEMAAFSAEGYEMFQKAAKKWGLLFHENPMFGEEKKKQEIVYISYPAEQAPIMEKILEAMKNVKVKEYQKAAEQKADEMGLKGKEKKEFLAASVQDSLQMFQSGNYKAGLEEYCVTSGIGRCSNEEFESAMKECYGEAYEEIRGEMGQELKKKKFDDAVDELSVWRENTEPVWICEKDQPDNYIRVSWAKHESSTENGESREYLASEFEVYYQGEKQRCEEFGHGNFSHYSWKNGSQSSEKGKEHWDNLKDEMKRKGGFSEEVYVFLGEKEYLDYKKQCGENREKKEAVLENSRKEERDRRVGNGWAVFAFSEKDIVDVDREEGKIKIDTGIRDKNGKNYFLWVEQKDVYHKEGKQFEFVFDDMKDVTLTSFSGNRKIPMRAMKFMEKAGLLGEHLQRWSEYIENQLEEIYNPGHGMGDQEDTGVNNKEDIGGSSQEVTGANNRKEDDVDNEEKAGRSSQRNFTAGNPDEFYAYNPEEFGVYSPEDAGAYNPEEFGFNPYNPEEFGMGAPEKRNPENKAEGKTEKVPEQKQSLKR